MSDFNDHGTQDLKPYSLQHILNQSFDRDAQILTFIPVGFDGAHAQRLNADNLSIQFDYDGGTNPVYIGMAAPGVATSAAQWLIRKLTFDGNNNVTAIQYANGNASFDQVFDDRVSLSYS